ncbi:hypothetical protein [Gloeothece verrucosa]|uniref:Uncharacterized protein n=1 Tax=Gloeothece verrucosa (strain PCC 7822) TaxID=497965 RepID=E0UDT6_GLOV7|nr:hypothetical protein [Gloeothece verrucosa]ADN16521.1 conserved hypothetical protein [Gloeothece verrucosa PCC 7822]
MNNLISRAISCLKEAKIERLFAGVLAAILFLVTNPNVGANSQPIGERIGQQQHQTSKNTERPKTTGEFLDEARGDVPLDERLYNITRDSAEAFQQFGEGIGNSAKETVKELKKNITNSDT